MKPKAGSQRLLTPRPCGYRWQRAGVRLALKQPELLLFCVDCFSRAVFRELFCVSCCCCSAWAVDFELFSLNFCCPAWAFDSELFSLNVHL